MRGDRLEPLVEQIQILENVVFYAPKKEQNVERQICIVIIILLIVAEFIIEAYL